MDQERQTIDWWIAMMMVWQVEHELTCLVFSEEALVVLVLEVVMSHLNMRNEMTRWIRRLLLNVMDKHMTYFTEFTMFSRNIQTNKVSKLLVRSLCDIINIM